jgi:hypothetical protein
MKTKAKQGRRRFQLQLTYWSGYYIDRIADLEKILRRKPRAVHIELIGAGEIPADSALLIRSVLLARSPKTRIVTNARSSLQGGSVMVWLLGDSRKIRDDAKVYFRQANLPEDAEAEPNADWKANEVKYRDSFSEIDLGEADYARVLEVINEFLPIKELAGRLIGVSVLRQFGLVEHDRLDALLATAFKKRHRALVPG